MFAGRAGARTSHKPVLCLEGARRAPGHKFLKSFLITPCVIAVLHG